MRTSNCTTQSLNFSICVVGPFAKLRKATISFVMSVCPSVRPSAWNNSAPTGRIVMKVDIWVFFENLLRKFKFHYNREKITGSSHEDKYTFFVIFHSVLLRMNVSHKSCRETRNTHFIFNNFFLNLPVYEIMQKNIVQRGRPYMTIWCMRIACCIPATNTHTHAV